MSHDTCCVPGCWRTGDTVKTIPLENITDCGIREPGTGCVGKCAGSLPIMYVDTASDLGSLPDQHEATAIGLADYQWFMEEILNRRDAIKGFVRSNYPQRHQQGVVGHDGTEAMDRGGPSSAAERIRTVTELHQSGVITEAQFEKKKQEIIDSI